MEKSDPEKYNAAQLPHTVEVLSRVGKPVKLSIGRFIHNSA